MKKQLNSRKRLMINIDHFLKLIENLLMKFWNIFVEESQKLSEEITIVQGLDSDELKNYYLVANYINILKKYNK